MRFLWTYRNNFGSRFQRSILEEPVSHFAVEHLGIVYNQIFGGFEIDFYEEWKKEYIVYRALVPTMPIEADEIIRTIVHKYRKQPYDFGAWLYFGYRGILRKIWRERFPKKNLLNNKNKPLCVSIAEEIYILYPEFFRHKPIDFDMITPWQLYENMLLSQKLELETSL